jgi:tetratricopeptide (TPR) repeat protein
VLKALALSGLQRHDEALPLLEDLWRTREATAGPRDKRVVSARFHYANALEIAGKAVEAEQHFAALVDVAREVLGPAHGLTLTSLTNAATLAFHRGDRQTGIERMRAAVAAFDARGLLPTHEHVVAINNLGQMLAATDRLAEAEPHLRRAAQLSRDLLAEDDANAILMRLNWGVCLVRLQRWPEAEPVLAEFERLDRLLPRDHPDRRRIVRAAASACEQAGHAEAAAEWRRRL